MSDNKPFDRRSPRYGSQQVNKDLNSAINELHQTIVRLNKVIEQVHPKTREAATKSFGRKAQEHPTLNLATLKIPDVIH